MRIIRLSIASIYRARGGLNLPPTDSVFTETIEALPILLGEFRENAPAIEKAANVRL